jgi:glutamate-1-semialdehyde 2,1-aminomutase
MLTYLEQHPELYDALETTTATIVENPPEGAHVNRVGSMFTFFFGPGPVRNYEEAKRSDTAAFGRFFHHMLDNGVYFPPAQFEAAFVSAAHTPHDISQTISAIHSFGNVPVSHGN